MNLSVVKEDLKKIKRTKFGISIPELRKYAQKIAREDYKTFVPALLIR